MITFDGFLEALNQVEAGGKKKDVPVGDGGRAVGPLQIHLGCWSDALEYLRRSDKQTYFSLPYTACRFWECSKVIAFLYLSRYAPHAMRVGNWEVLARVWNGGPAGHRKAATLPYWRKVKAALAKMEGVK